MNIFINGQLLPEKEACVSVFDSGFVLGDGVWEGIRIVEGHPVFLEPHFDRLFGAAKGLMLDVGLDHDAMERAVYQTIEANGLENDAHLRLMVTRGVRREPYQDPRLASGPATVVIIPTQSPHNPETDRRGLDLFTTHIRRGYPDVQDSKINSHSKFTCISACIQAAQAGADEALMLDPHGFVATCNSTHFFIVRRGEVWTSTGRYCLAGITRANVIEICRRHGIPCLERDFTLSEVYGAEEAFVTGTLRGLAPVRMIDGRSITKNPPGALTLRLQTLYTDLTREDLTARRNRLLKS